MVGVCPAYAPVVARRMIATPAGEPLVRGSPSPTIEEEYRSLSMDTMGHRLNGRTSRFASRREADLQARFPDLYRCDCFRQEIRREVHRSDRFGGQFTLLLLDVAQGGEDRDGRWSWLNELAGIVGRAARKSDTAGWFRDADGLRLGILLHQADSKSIHRVITGIHGQFAPRPEATPRAGAIAGEPRGAPALSCEVFPYPDPHPEQAEDRTDQLVMFEPAPAVDSAPASGAGPNGSNGSNGSANGAARLIDAPEPIAGPDWIRLRSSAALAGVSVPRGKRILDVIGSAFGLTLLSPVLALVAILVKLTSRGPVFFRQERVGRHGRPFELIKFRTMANNFDSSGHKKYLGRLIGDEERNSDEAGEAPMIKQDSENRSITPLGRFLRKTYLDELPQLINVFRGDMSLVGPRPCLPYEAEKYHQWHRRRFDCVPGMTGLWQVSGKNRLTFRQMIRHDINYSRRSSVGFDLRIILRTPATILTELMARDPEKAAK